MVTRIKVKNLSKGPLIGFKADEYWYSAKGEAISGSPTFRHPKPFMPNEVIEVVCVHRNAADEPAGACASSRTETAR